MNTKDQKRFLRNHPSMSRQKMKLHQVGSHKIRVAKTTGRTRTEVTIHHGLVTVILQVSKETDREGIPQAVTRSLIEEKRVKRDTAVMIR